MLFLEQKVAKLHIQKSTSSQICKFLEWMFYLSHQTFKTDYVKNYFEFPCFAKNIIRILQKMAVFGAKISEIAHTNTGLAAKVANIYLFIFVLCHKRLNTNV
jgi:hypothetical protein